MKGVASCDKLRVGAGSLRSEDALMGLPTGTLSASQCFRKEARTLRKETSE